jgi:hypothetical protein
MTLAIPWASQIRTADLMKRLVRYGTHAKAVIPELTKISNYIEKDEKDFPKKLMHQKANLVTPGTESFGLRIAGARPARNNA